MISTQNKSRHTNRFIRCTVTAFAQHILHRTVHVHFVCLPKVYEMAKVYENKAGVRRVYIKSQTKIRKVSF